MNRHHFDKQTKNKTINKKCKVKQDKTDSMTNLTLNGGKLSLCLSDSLINSNAFSPNILFKN